VYSAIFAKLSKHLVAQALLACFATLAYAQNPPPVFSKEFNPDWVILFTVTDLTFTIDNTASTVAAANLDFTDNLPAGLTVTGAFPAATTCVGGTLTAVPGSGTLSYAGGTVPAGASCTVSLGVDTSVLGVFVNTTGDLTSSSGNSGPATDTLTVSPGAPPPAFSKDFSPSGIIVGDTATLTFTIDNLVGSIDVTSLDFTDDLPAAIIVAPVPNASTTCTGGTLTAVAGGGTITYTGGTVAAGTVCTVSVDTTSSTVGFHLNTSGPLTSSQGSSGTASSGLTVEPLPTFGKAFAPNPIDAGGTSTLTFTIGHAGSEPCGFLNFTDNLPAGVNVAAPPNGLITCNGGALTAAPGGTVIVYDGGDITPGTTCTVSVDVTSDTPGTYVNTSGDLTSSHGNSGPATDTLTVNAAPVPALGAVWLAVLAGLLGVVAFWQLRFRL
jgi:hypothetical protein